MNLRFPSTRILVTTALTLPSALIVARPLGAGTLDTDQQEEGGDASPPRVLNTSASIAHAAGLSGSERGGGSSSAFGPPCAKRPLPPRRFEFDEEMGRWASSTDQSIAASICRHEWIDALRPRATSTTLLWLSPGSQVTHSEEYDSPEVVRITPGNVGSTVESSKTRRV